MKTLRIALIAAATWMAACPVDADADEVPDASGEYLVTSWGYKDGLPSGGVHGIAQDAEGYLWLGTNTGLIKFDGVTFSRWESKGRTPLPVRPIHQILSARDGSLWLGFGAAGGIARLVDGRVLTYGEGEGLLSGAVTALVQASDGVVWASNVSGLFHFTGDRWEQVGAKEGLPEGAVFSVYVDDNGQVFAGTAGAVLRRSASGGRFEHVAIADERVLGITKDASGTLVITDPISALRRIGERRETPDRERSPTRGRGYALLRDSRGTLWAGTSGQGLWRLPGGPEKAAERRGRWGLTEILGDWVLGLIQDREGNVWAATYEGLNRLSPAKVVAVPEVSTASAIDLAKDGSIWVATADSLIRFADLDGRWQTVQRLHVPGLRALHVNAGGTVWVATNSDVLHLVRDQLISALPTRRDGALSQITSITSDPGGGLWLYSRGEGPYRLNDGRLEALPWTRDFDAAPAVSAYTDSRGRVWFTSGRGGVRVIVPGATESRTYGVRDGLDEKDYGLLYEDRQGNIWLGGRGALSRFKDERIQTVSGRHGFPEEIVRSIIEDDYGDLWIGTGSGIVRMNPAEFDRALASDSVQIRYSLFDVSDGVYGLPVFHGSRNAVRTRDGRLWFVTARGMTIVDPNALRTPRPAPTVSVEGVVADGRRLALGTPIALPARTSTLEIQYSALELTSPQKIRFRYILKDFDKTWIEGNPGNQARYANLPPGEYSFRVAAVTGESAGDPPEAVLPLSVPPVFYRTTWFYLVMSLAAIMAVWTVWRLRSWQIHRTYSRILEERARLGRAIHDTLLQSLVGIAWQCDVIASDLETAAPATRAKFLRMRDLVEGYIREARHSIWDLRSPSLERRALSTALLEAGEHSADGSGVEFEFIVNGTPRRCPDAVEEQMLRIGQEAVFNAIRHGKPNLVRMELEYTPESVQLRVADDGQGFDAELALKSANGHYGLIGMKERAETAGGIFHVASAPGRGTNIEAILPTLPHE